MKLLKDVQNINKRRNKLLDLSGINEFHVDLQTITSDLIIEILKKNSNERELKDYSILNDYLLFVSKLTEKLRSQRIPQSLYEKIVLLSLQSCKLKVFLTSKTKIYTPETEANYLYIILKGSAKNIKVQKHLIKMKAFDYYKLLINLRNDGEKYLLKNTIHENSGIFPIDFEDIEYLDKIVLKILLISRKTEKNDFDYLDNLLLKAGLTYQSFGLKHSYREELRLKNQEIEKENLELVKGGKGNQCKELFQYDFQEAENYLIDQEKVIDDQLNFISYDIYQKYMFFLYNKEEFVTVFELVDDKILINNDFFGDYYGSKYIDFAESVEDNLYVLLFKNDIINQVYDVEKDKISRNNADFLMNNFFFRSIKKNVFEKYYLNIFEFENYQSGQKICLENETVKYLYFIKKGRVRLSYTKSILEIHSLINIIKEQIKQKQFEEKKDNGNPIINFLEKNQKYYNLKGDVNSIKSELNYRQERSLMIYQENQCLGFESYYYGLKYLYTAFAESDKVEIYKISITQLAKIFNNNNDRCYLDLSKQAENTLFFLMRRLIKINNFLMNFCEKRKASAEDDEKNQIKMKMEEEQQKKIDENNLDIKHKKKTLRIKKSEISRILPSLFNKIRNPINSDNLRINKSSFSLMEYNKLPSLNFQNQSSILDRSEYEKNILNDKGKELDTEKSNKIANIKHKILVRKLINQKKSKLFITGTKEKINDLNKSRDNNSINSINSSYYNNSKYLKDSKISNLSCLQFGNTNINGESKINEDESSDNNIDINLSYIFNQNQTKNTGTQISLYPINNKRMLMSEKLKNFMNIKKKLMLKKSKIYRAQKDKLKSMFNNYYIEE